jgi:hypothetical protein
LHNAVAVGERYSGITPARRVNMAGYDLMQPNIGRTDRYIRLALGSWFLASGTARMARDPDLMACGMGLLGSVMLAEGVLGVCMAYHMAGIDTRDDGDGGIDVP